MLLQVQDTLFLLLYFWNIQFLSASNLRMLCYNLELAHRRHICVNLQTHFMVNFRLVYHLSPYKISHIPNVAPVVRHLLKSK